jgi:tetratricopeptide (TPR) repeat protein
VNKFVSISAIFTILCLINFPFLSNSAPIDQEISKAYTASEYGTAIRLLEQQIEEQRERLLKGEKVEFQKLYKQYLLLAHIYAWRLNKPDVALLKYQELTEWKKLYPPPSKFPTFELLYIAEIYEARKDWVKAREYYQYLLNELADFSEKENDDVSILMSEDLKQFVKYQMDGLHLKTRTEKRRKPNIGSVENLWFLVRLDVVRWT